MGFFDRFKKEKDITEINENDEAFESIENADEVAVEEEAETYEEAADGEVVDETKANEAEESEVADEILYDAEDLLSKHDKGEIDDGEFLRAFGKINVFYTTPFGEDEDGNKKLFLVPSADKACYNPVFSTEDRLVEYNEMARRENYVILQNDFASLLEMTKKFNEDNGQVKMGVIIDPCYFDVIVDVAMLDTVIEMTKA